MMHLRARLTTSKKIKKLGITSLALVAFSVSGCGGKTIVPTKPAELSVPPDLAKAFEVKELAPAETSKKTEAVKKHSVAKHRRHRRKKGEDLAPPGEMGLVIPNRRPKVEPLWVGEKIWMDVTWLNTKAGEFLLEVLPFKVMNGRKVYDIKGTARTSDLFSLIYKAEDWVETFVDYEGWFPYKFVLHGDETKHIRDTLELFDHGAKKQYVHELDNRIQNNEVHEEKGFKDLTPFSQDSMSAIHYVRTQKLYEGAVINFPMTTGGHQWETRVLVLGKEEVSTKMGYMRAFKCKVETRFKGVLQQQGDAFMWFSDDERKYPLRFEAKVRIGWVMGIAKKIEPGIPPYSDQLQQELGKDGKKTMPMQQKPAGPSADSIVPEKKRKSRVWFQNLLESLKK